MKKTITLAILILILVTTMTFLGLAARNRCEKCKEALATILTSGSLNGRE